MKARCIDFPEAMWTALGTLAKRIGLKRNALIRALCALELKKQKLPSGVDETQGSPAQEEGMPNGKS